MLSPREAKEPKADSPPEGAREPSAARTGQGPLHLSVAEQQTGHQRDEKEFSP